MIVTRRFRPRWAPQPHFRLIDYLAPTPIFDDVAKKYGCRVTTFLIPDLRDEKGPLLGEVKGQGDLGYFVKLDASLQGKKLAWAFLHEIGHLKKRHTARSKEDYEKKTQDLARIVGRPLEEVKAVKNCVTKIEHEPQANEWANAEYERLKNLAGDRWDDMSAEEILQLVV